MNLTLKNWLVLIVGFIVTSAIIVGIVYAWGELDGYEEKVIKKRMAIAGAVVLALFVAIGFIMNWYNTNTASGIRNYKDYQSEMSNGIEREITITAEDGREIYHYKGKVDVESDHEDNYIKFEREDGGREIIYYGITDTVLITEIK